MPTKHFIADAPDGTLVHRSSTTREYSHAVIVNGGNGWGAWGWAGRADLAQKTLAQAAKQYPDAKIVEAREVDGKTIDHEGGKATLKEAQPEKVAKTKKQAKKVAKPKSKVTPMEGPNPTKAMYDTMYAAYDHFHKTLFGSRLTPVVLLIHRKRNAHGYFWEQQWRTKGEKKNSTAEIALNPETMGRDLVEVMSTLVHEMAHQEDALYGQVPTHGHGETWVAMMEAVGLLPIALDAKDAPKEFTYGDEKPKFKQTGRAVSHIVMKDGPFAKECEKLLKRKDLDFTWFSVPQTRLKKRDPSKVKHTCDCGFNIWCKEGLQAICPSCEMMFVEGGY